MPATREVGTDFSSVTEEQRWCQRLAEDQDHIENRESLSEIK